MRKNIDRFYPDDEPEISGDVPAIDPIEFKSHVLDRLSTLKAIGEQLLPKTHELKTLIGKGEKEISLDNLEFEDQDGPDFKARIVEGIGTHKKEIAATSVTVAGLLLILHQVRARQKDKK
jgi:hypothetical protein